MKKKMVSVVCASLSALALSVSAFAQTMYAPDGRTEEVAQSDVQAWQNVGWYTYPVINVYAPDGRVVPIAESDLQDWQNVGWYAYPVINVYAPDGRVVTIAQSDLQDWQNVGWYAYPVINVYAPDGRVVPIAQSDLQDWQNVGWYAYPVMNVYAPDGRVVTIAQSDLQEWKNVGWYATAAEAQAKNVSYSSGGSSNGYGGGKWYGGNTASYTEGTSETVYIGQTGTKYHKKNCKTLKNGAYPISLEQAKREGRTACRVCGG